MNRVGREWVRTRIEGITEESRYDLVRVLVFGSRARGDHRADRDIDVLLVSPNFEEGPFYRGWDYDTLPSPEFVPLTPAEFDERVSAESPTVVRTAVDEGIDLMK